jgi:nucleoside-diphosphate-sugar epimerase
MLGRESLPTLPTWFASLARTRPANLARRLTGRQVIGPWSLHFRRNPSRFSVERAMQVLGYVPKIDFAEGMRRTEMWLRSAGYL